MTLGENQPQPAEDKANKGCNHSGNTPFLIYAHFT